MKKVFFFFFYFSGPDLYGPAMGCQHLEHLRNEFHFSGVHGAMNRSGSRAK